MTVEDPLTIHIGDGREILPDLPSESVQCCVTSPPYWGLRDYGTGKWKGGDADCDHGVLRWDGPKQTQGAQSGHASRSDRLKRNVCGKCGALRVDRQLGMEPTPEAYVASLVGIFREVRRILKSDGTLWLNLGDSYSGYHGNSRVVSDEAPSNKPGYIENMRKSTVGISGLKPKDLVGIPWMVALALRADGWYLRQDIIWHKPNPMPESVRDRCTKAHEYIFLLSKSERYYYDHEAIKEPAAFPPGTRPNVVKGGFKSKYAGDVARIGDESFRAIRQTRNRRSVWTVTTKPYKGAHFATYPKDLIEPCILAGTRPGDTVLDPFAGSGTTGEVALNLGRRAELIELNPEYSELIHRRTNSSIGLAIA